MRVLALDQATQTGWAVGDGNSFERKNVQSGIFKMPKRPTLGERLVIFADLLGEIVEFYKPDLIAYERPYWPAPGPPAGSIMASAAIAIINRSTARGAMIAAITAASTKKGPPPIDIETLQFLQKVEGQLIETATRHGLPYEAYASASWRKTALGFSRTPPEFAEEADWIKKAMVHKARLLGYTPQSFDEADAIGILLHALHGAPANERAQGDLLQMASEDASL